MDSEKWKKIKRSGGFRRKVNRSYKLLKTATIPTLQHLGETKRCQAQDGSNENGSVHFSTFNQANAGTSQDSIDQSGTHLILQESILNNENESEINISDFSEENNPKDMEEAESSEDDEDDKDDEFRNDFKKWAINCNVPHETIKKVTEIINRRLPHILPKDPRTLLQTKTVSITPLDNGYYWHNGVIEPLKNILEHLTVIPESISLNINIDGLPIYKSSREQVWPILCNIYEKPYLSPFVVGIYSGKGKPTNLEAYFRSFVAEMKELFQNGLKITTKYGNELLVKITIRAFICDSPARALIKGVCNFNGKHGCLKCTVVGEYSHQSNTVIFPKTDCPKRNNNDFRSKMYGQHHKYDSPLLELPIDMIEAFPVGDSLHLIDLGIMKRLLIGWRDGNFGKKVTKLCARDIEKLSQFMMSCRLPTEIHRSVRNIDVLAHWKASEFRTFLYYLSFIILKDLLCPDAYHHFLLFFCAVTIFSNDKHFAFLRLGDTLLKSFVENYRRYYGKEYLTSNVHNLIHVIDEVKRFGVLQSFNAYPFENKLYCIKRMVRNGNRTLSQIARRIIEKNSIELESYDSNEFKIPFIRKCRSNNGFISILHLKNFVLSTQAQNKWFLTISDHVVEILLIDNNNGNIEIQGKCFNSLSNVFETPIKSSFLNIYQICNFNINNDSECLYYTVNDIKCKLVSVTYNNTRFFIPLLHTL